VKRFNELRESVPVGGLFHSDCVDAGGAFLPCAAALTFGPDGKPDI